MCDVCGGNMSKSIACRMQKVITFAVMWLPWPSMTTSRWWVGSVGRVEGSNTVVSHSKAWLCDVQSLFLQPIASSRVPDPSSPPISITFCCSDGLESGQWNACAFVVKRQPDSSASLWLGPRQHVMVSSLPCIHRCSSLCRRYVITPVASGHS
jgi:hypothetical protein